MRSSHSALFCPYPLLQHLRKTGVKKSPLYCRFKWPYFWPVLKKRGKTTFFPLAWTSFPVEPEIRIPGSAIRGRIGRIWDTVFVVVGVRKVWVPDIRRGPGILWLVQTDFKSTYPHRVRLPARVMRVSFFIFQSTYPRGVRRLTASGCPPGLFHFNPRARTGHDNCSAISITMKRVFQSTCPHGARQFAGGVRAAGTAFQSTCPHGARQRLSSCSPSSWYFNPRARTGHDQPTLEPDVLTGRFQSTCPHGARLRWCLR